MSLWTRYNASSMCLTIAFLLYRKADSILSPVWTEYILCN